MARKALMLDKLKIHAKRKALAVVLDKNQYPSVQDGNQYLFYDSIIPVERDEKWGLYNINGEVILPVEYDSIGCIVTSTQTKSANNAVLLINSFVVF